MIGDTIRILRLERGVSPEELGDAIGVGKEAIEFYEANKWQPGMPTIAKLAKFFGVTVDGIVKGCSLVYDSDKHEFLVVKNMGGNQIKVIGKVRDENHKSE